MKPRSGLHSRLAVAAVMIALAIVCVSMGAAPDGNKSATFEYKVVSSSTLVQEIAIKAMQLRHEQQGTRSPKAAIDPPSDSELASKVVQKIENTLNELGAEGWELAGVTDSFYILKRPAR